MIYKAKALDLALVEEMKLVETWVKAPFLKESSLLVVGECVQTTFPNAHKKFEKERVVLSSCPETENHGLIVSKLATILACAKPKNVTVLTVDGSPHCFGLHAALSQALFLTKTMPISHHYVIVNGKVLKVSAESVRVGRYLHLVQRCLNSCPEILGELNRLSLEQRCFTKASSK